MTEAAPPDSAPPEWRPPHEIAERPRGLALRRGFMGRCPACGEGRMFGAFLKVNDACAACGEELHHHRADDAPPYVVITIVGHVVLMAIMLQEEFRPDTPMWLYAAIWLPATLLMSLALLPAVKGALIGWQWALRMHGFGDPRPGEKEWMA